MYATSRKAATATSAAMVTVAPPSQAVGSICDPDRERNKEDDRCGNGLPRECLRRIAVAHHQPEAS
jgi:hypothetical protein